MKTQKADRCQLNFRLTPEELKLYEAAADDLGLKTSAWVRMVARKAARKQLAQTKASA